MVARSFHSVHVSVPPLLPTPGNFKHFYIGNGISETPLQQRQNDVYIYIEVTGNYVMLPNGLHK